MGEPIQDYSDALSSVNQSIDIAAPMPYSLVDPIATARVKPFKQARDSIANGWRQAMGPPVDTDLGLQALAAMQALASDARNALVDANGQPKQSIAQDAAGVAGESAKQISDAAKNFAAQFPSLSTLTWIVGGALLLGAVGVGYVIYREVKRK